MTFQNQAQQKNFLEKGRRSHKRKKKVGLIGQNVKHGKNIEQYLKKIRNKLSNAGINKR